MYAEGITNADDRQNFSGSVPEKLLSNVYLNLSNYVHGRYPETMDLCGGNRLSFHLRWMGGTSKDEENYEMLEVSIESVSTLLRTMVRRLALSDLLKDDASLQVWFDYDFSPNK
jgi:hypothetical protein